MYSTLCTCTYVCVCVCNQPQGCGCGYGDGDGDVARTPYMRIYKRPSRNPEPQFAARLFELRKACPDDETRVTAQHQRRDPFKDPIPCNVYIRRKHYTLPETAVMG